MLDDVNKNANCNHTYDQDSTQQQKNYIACQ